MNLNQMDGSLFFIDDLFIFQKKSQKKKIVYDRDLNIAIRRVFGNNIPEIIGPPLFGGEINHGLPLTKKGFWNVEIILKILGFDYSELRDCPILPSILTLLLHFATPSEAFGVALQIVRTGLKHSNWIYFPMGKKEFQIFSLVFLEVVQKLMPKLYQFINSLEDSSEWHSIWDELFTCFFIGHLPFTSLFRILDCFCFEGYKIFYRIALGVLKQLEKYLYACDSISAINGCIKRELSVSEGSRFESLLGAGFSIEIHRATINKMR